MQTPSKRPPQKLLSIFITQFFKEFQDKDSISENIQINSQNIPRTGLVFFFIVAR